MEDENAKTFEEFLNERKIDRRSFIKWCGAIAAVLALPAGAAKAIAQTLAASPRVPVIWLEFQDCTGDTESFLRAGRRPDPLQSDLTDPSITDLLLDFLSVDYHETLMVPSGLASEKSREDTIARYAGQYIAIVEGSIPTAQNGIFCTIGGKTALSIAQHVLGNARATLAMGDCAVDGGLPFANPNPTGALGVHDAVPSVPNLINLPGCPANVANMVACLVHFIANGAWPDLGQNYTPRFAYDKTIHSVCPRRTYHDGGKFVLAWGDEGHRKGWCLQKMGCKGPKTQSNCPTVKWNDGTSFPIEAGHGCIGCTTLNFWDRFPQIYSTGN